MLRVMQSKFNRTTGATTADTWGPAHFSEAIPCNAQEEKMRNMIFHKSMPLRTAKARLGVLNGELPYMTRMEYMQDLAALCSVYAEEVKKRSSKAFLYPLCCGARRSRTRWHITSTTCGASPWCLPTNAPNSQAGQLGSRL